MTPQWIVAVPAVIAAKLADRLETTIFPPLFIDKGHPFRQRMHNIR